MQKNVPAEGRTRRVLQDIGNMVAERAVEVKLQAQPIARSLSLSLSHTHTLTHHLAHVLICVILVFQGFLYRTNC